MIKSYTKEADVKTTVKRLLTRHGYFWWMPPSNGYGKTGISDFNALHNGVFLAVETKFGSNRPTPMQKAYLQSVMAEGGFAFVVDEKTHDVFAKWLEAFERSTIATSKGQKPADEDGALMLDCIKKLTEAIV